MGQAAQPSLRTQPLPDGPEYGARQLEILAELETIVLTEGFRDLTVGGLAGRLRCSRRTLYEIADSKDALVLLVLDRLMRRIAVRAHEAAAAESSDLDRLRAFLTRGLSELRRATVNFAEDVAADETAGRLITVHFRYAKRTVEKMLADGMAAGEYAQMNPRIATEVLDAAVARILEPAVLRESGVSFAQALDEVLSLFASGIRAPGAARYLS